MRKSHARPFRLFVLDCARHCRLQFNFKCRSASTKDVDASRLSSSSWGDNQVNNSLFSSLFVWTAKSTLTTTTTAAATARWSASWAAASATVSGCVDRCLHHLFLLLRLRQQRQRQEIIGNDNRPSTKVSTTVATTTTIRFTAAAAATSVSIRHKVRARCILFSVYSFFFSIHFVFLNSCAKRMNYWSLRVRRASMLASWRMLNSPPWLDAWRWWRRLFEQDARLSFVFAPLFLLHFYELKSIKRNGASGRRGLSVMFLRPCDDDDDDDETTLLSLIDELCVCAGLYLHLPFFQYSIHKRKKDSSLPSSLFLSAAAAGLCVSSCVRVGRGPSWTDAPILIPSPSLFIIVCTILFTRLVLAVRPVHEALPAVPYCYRFTANVELYEPCPCLALPCLAIIISC